MVIEMLPELITAIRAAAMANDNAPPAWISRLLMIVKRTVLKFEAAFSTLFEVMVKFFHNEAGVSPPWTPRLTVVPLVMSTST